jgi:FkbM family methyltransferase
MQISDILFLKTMEVLQYAKYPFVKKPYPNMKLHYYKRMMKEFMKYFREDHFDFDGIKLPDFRNDEKIANVFFASFVDIFSEHLRLNYPDEEGSYEWESVRIHKDYVVLDIGAWIGDFSAYASYKGATVYAFEPDEDNFKWLKETAKLNKNIYPIQLALGDKCSTMHINKRSSGSFIDTSGQPIEVLTVDEFVKRNNIQKVDFIKADIEGWERYMLAGATNTLKIHKPRLSICTYHNKEDKELLTKIIKEANPDYKIYYGKMKLYAW